MADLSSGAISQTRRQGEGFFQRLTSRSPVRPGECGVRTDPAGMVDGPGAVGAAAARCARGSASCRARLFARGSDAGLGDGAGGTQRLIAAPGRGDCARAHQRCAEPPRGHPRQPDERDDRERGERAPARPAAAARTSASAHERRQGQERRRALGKQQTSGVGRSQLMRGTASDRLKV